MLRSLECLDNERDDTGRGQMLLNALVVVPSLCGLLLLVRNPCRKASSLCQEAKEELAYSVLSNDQDSFLEWWSSTRKTPLYLLLKRQNVLGCLPPLEVALFSLSLVAFKMTEIDVDQLDTRVM